MNEKSPVYSSKHIMSKEMVYDFCSVDFNRTKKIFILNLCLVLALLVMNHINRYDNMIFCFGAMVLSIFMVGTFFNVKRSIKIGYERVLLNEGKEVTVCYELFDDSIVMRKEENVKEISYEKVTKFFETKKFIMLHLQHNMHITIEKSSLNGNIDEVKAFVVDKCTNVKNKKFVNCANDEKWSIALLIAIIAVTAAGTAAHILLTVL